MNYKYYRLTLSFVVLLQMGGCATYESNPLIVSIRSEDIADVTALINSGANVNSLSYDYINGQPWKITPLIRASLTGNAEIVSVLIEAGANVNGTDVWGDTALMGAAESNSHKVAQILIDAGADINATKPDLTTALMIAARKGYLDVVNLLLDAGADADVGSDSGDTALSLATQNGHTRVVEALKQKSQIKAKSTLYVRIKVPDYVYEYDKVKYEVYPGEVLEVLNRERCRGGVGECWRVRNVKTGEVGYVFEDKVRKRHFVFTGKEP